MTSPQGNGGPSAGYGSVAARGDTRTGGDAECRLLRAVTGMASVRDALSLPAASPSSPNVPAAPAAAAAAAMYCAHSPTPGVLGAGRDMVVATAVGRPELLALPGGLAAVCRLR
jgi:hypothetical protein